MKRGIVILICALVVLGAHAQEAVHSQPQLPAKENFYLFILAGQSNMAGRGTIEAVDRVPHPRVLSLNKEREWVLAVAPIHFDKPIAGVGLGKSFAVALVDKNPEITIGLIPTACGGSPISSWEPGGYHKQTRTHPYDNLIERARLAMEDGVLKGILWHQGESDSKPELADVYKVRLEALFSRLRKDLDAPRVPILIGQLGRFPSAPWNESRDLVNEAHIAVAAEMPQVAFVASDGLTCKADNVHFNSKSLRIFGRRYAEAYLEIVEQ